jgi:hypothetical protein
MNAQAADNIFVPPVGRVWMLFSICIAAAAVICGCTQSKPPAPPQNQDDVLEAVVRYEIAKHSLGPNEIYFIQINDADPSAEFLSRLKDITPIKVYSKCKNTPAAGWNDIETGRHGTVIFARGVDINVNGTATANGGYNRASLAWSAYTYTLEWKNGKWVVVKTECLYWEMGRSENRVPVYGVNPSGGCRY